MRYASSGEVDLVEFMGGDLSVVNSARISFGKQSYDLSEADEKLIGFLLKHRHGTPFESSVFTFQVHAPITVAREWVRHRISSWNEVSGRYVELEPLFYLPTKENVRRQVGKPGRYTYEPVPAPTASSARQLMWESYSVAWSAYQDLLGLGVAKEVARNVLPVGIFTEWRWTVNARSLMNFLELRTAPNAMLEIRSMAQWVEAIFQDKMPVTAAAFIENGRRAP